LVLEISKSAVQHHYRRAVHQVRLALGLAPPSEHVYDVSEAPI